MKSCQQIVTSLSFSLYMANLVQSGRRIPDAWSVKLRFSLTVAFYLTETVAFYLTETKTRTKKL